MFKICVCIIDPCVVILRYQGFRGQELRIEIDKWLYESSRAVDTVGGLPRASSSRDQIIYTFCTLWRITALFSDTGTYWEAFWTILGPIASVWSRKFLEYIPLAWENGRTRFDSESLLCLKSNMGAGTTRKFMWPDYLYVLHPLNVHNSFLRHKNLLRVAQNTPGTYSFSLI